MFEWLRRLWVTWFGSEPYPSTKRLIFRYWDGYQWISADPMVLWKRVMEVGPALAIDIKVSRSTSKDARKAHDASQRKIREIFNLPPTDPFAMAKGGLGETEVAELLDTFMGFCEGLKKNTNPSAISPATMPAPSDSSTDASPVMPSGSDSGSIASGNSIAEPVPSPSVVVSPSEALNPPSTSTGP